MIELKQHAQGVILPVRAQAGGRLNAIRGEERGMLKVSVTQIAEKGKANSAIVDVLVQALGLRRSQLQLITGETSPQKQFLVQGIASADLQIRLRDALASTSKR